MLPLTISYNYEIVYHRQKESESLKSPFLCCFDRFFSFLHFLMAYFSTKSENLILISFSKGETCAGFSFFDNVNKEKILRAVSRSTENGLENLPLLLTIIR